MSDKEIQNALQRYYFLVDLLDKINDKTNQSLVNDSRWFVFGPKVCAKFVSQAKTLILLFTDKFLEPEDGETKKYEDISTIYSVIRMQFETHALFYHLFVPSENIEENILRFRLWELDGIRHRISITGESSNYHQHERSVEAAINQIPFYNQLDLNIQNHLIKKAQWRFTATSIKENFRLPISYEQLIRNTQIKESIYFNMYARFSAYTHPTYSGIIDNYQLTSGDAILERRTAILYASFVTAFFIEDISKRFVEAGKKLDTLTPAEFEVYISMISHGRYNSPQA